MSDETFFPQTVFLSQIVFFLRSFFLQIVFFPQIAFFSSDRPLFSSDRPLFSSDRPLFSSDRFPLFSSDHFFLRSKPIFESINNGRLTSSIIEVQICALQLCTTTTYRRSFEAELLATRISSTLDFAIQREESIHKKADKLGDA